MVGGEQNDITLDTKGDSLPWLALTERVHRTLHDEKTSHDYDSDLPHPKEEWLWLKKLENVWLRTSPGPSGLPGLTQSTELCASIVGVGSSNYCSGRGLRVRNTARLSTSGLSSYL